MQSGLVLLVEAIIPVGDMVLILAAKGSAKTTFGMHGVTAVLISLAAIPPLGCPETHDRCTLSVRASCEAGRRTTRSN